MISNKEAEIYLFLDLLYGDEKETDLFMESKQTIFDGRRPSDMIAEGDINAVYSHVKAMSESLSQ